MNKNLIIQIASFFIFCLLQILIFKNAVLFNVGFCFIYLAFLLLLPVELALVTGMVLGFLTGLTIDIFYNSLGIHAAASVFLMFLRPFWLNVLTPRSGYETGGLPAIKTFGFLWFMLYAGPLILAHLLIVFFVETGGFQLVGLTLLKTVSSSVFSLVFIISIQYLFYPSRKS